MRKIVLFIFLFLITIGCFAQKVALHNSSGVQYFNGISALVNAYSTATNGDTLYLSGGGFTSPTTIDKGLRIYGAGHYPDSTTTTGKTFLNGNITLSENADGMQMEGIELNGYLYTTINHAIDQIVIKYCRIIGQVNLQGNLSNPCNNWLFINCVFTATVSFNNIYSCAVYNSIFQGQVFGSGHLFENNLFPTSTYYVVDGSNNIFRNNIFSGSPSSARYITGNSNQFHNNIFTLNPLLGVSYIASNNYYPVVGTTIYNNVPTGVFSYDYDYHLQAPETYLGTDGSEVGIYGGSYPYKEGAVPSNPHIFLKNISAQTNNLGELNIEIGVEAQER